MQKSFRSLWHSQPGSNDKFLLEHDIRAEIELLLNTQCIAETAYPSLLNYGIHRDDIYQEACLVEKIKAADPRITDVNCAIDDSNRLLITVATQFDTVFTLEYPS